ncbi:MAG TPA: hypothetical protein ENI13_02025, partial [candidate division CPR3 bacterium]|nr:hypothetical protein [candidate division CPR3 bacterium]
MMVDQAKMRRVMPKKIIHKVVPIAKMGKEPLILPNYSGVKKFVAERDNVFSHDQLSGVSADDHHAQT